MKSIVLFTLIITLVVASSDRQLLPDQTNYICIGYGASLTCEQACESKLSLNYGNCVYNTNGNNPFRLCCCDSLPIPNNQHGCT
jgi:hypothetical protein